MTAAGSKSAAAGHARSPKRVKRRLTHKGFDGSLDALLRLLFGEEDLASRLAFADAAFAGRALLFATRLDLRLVRHIECAL